MKTTDRYMLKAARLLFALSGFLLAFAVPGCATTSKVTGPVVSVVKDCADQVTHSATLSILDDVSAVLICDRGDLALLPVCVTTQLAVIAGKAGWAAVDCALAEISQKAAANAAASEDPTEALRSRRAQAAQGWRKGPPAAASR